MRKSLPFLSILAGITFITMPATAQQKDQFTYAITDINPQGGANWAFLRKLNLQTGEYSQVILSGDNATMPAYDAITKKQFTQELKDPQYGIVTNAAFSSGVAAMAYDKKNNRLYYTPMLIDQLRYLDLKTMKVYFVADRSFTGKPQKSPDQGNIVTRMVIAADGNGYAMTNDGTQLIRFSIGKKLDITDLGSIVDDPANNGISIHNSCSSFGGDMIADDNGNLYVFSARNHVFKVNIESKVATHLGVINGLPNGFTVNGAAVNEDNLVVVSSAMQSSSYFTVNPKTLAASPYAIKGTVWQSSDLANSNLYVSGSRPSAVTTDVITSKTTIINDNKISIYPNPVTNNQFTLQFNQLEVGKYSLQITDVMGRQIKQQDISINGENQSQNINLGAATSKGVYLVNVTDATSKTVFSTKLVIQ
jgi:hypothetical protein